VEKLLLQIRAHSGMSVSCGNITSTHKANEPMSLAQFRALTELLTLRDIVEGFYGHAESTCHEARLLALS